MSVPEWELVKIQPEGRMPGVFETLTPILLGKQKCINIDTWLSSTFVLENYKRLKQAFTVPSKPDFEEQGIGQSLHVTSSLPYIICQ